MSLVFDIFIIILLFSLFGISHSVLAAYDVKSRIADQIGNKIAFYRIFYNISSLIFFVAIYYLAPKPDILLYDLHFPFDLIILGIQFLGLVGFFWTGSYINLKEFLGISQIERYLNGSYNIENLDEKAELELSGPFRISRHPIYFFSIVVLGFRSSMDVFYLIFFICLTMYFYIGSFYEEKSLTKRFGKKYMEYRSTVPRIVPNPFLLTKK